jgi:hypothetical protein
MPFPFEVSPEELAADIDSFVDSVYAGLSSDFITMPRGKGFVDYATFETGYEALKKATSGFARLEPAALLDTIIKVPIAFVVVRAMLGFSPSELAYTTTIRTRVEVDQGFARNMDRKVRLDPLTPIRPSELTRKRLEAMTATAAELIVAGVPEGTPPNVLHRLSKIDTEHGLESLRAAARLNVPYAVLLYERFLGRPFAAHRDSVSELVGDALESAIERTLAARGVSHYKTKRADKVPGMKQAPDFIIPSWNNPKIIIEAKVTEDDGTARDKVTRIINLVNLSKEPPDGLGGPRGYQVVAALAGRGFAVRRQDMRNLLLATGGKVFTLATIGHLVDHTAIREFATIEAPPPPECAEAVAAACQAVTDREDGEQGSLV